MGGESLDSIQARLSETVDRLTPKKPQFMGEHEAYTAAGPMRWDRRWSDKLDELWKAFQSERRRDPDDITGHRQIYDAVRLLKPAGFEGKSIMWKAYEAQDLWEGAVFNDGNKRIAVTWEGMRESREFQLFSQYIDGFNQALGSI